MGSLPFALSIHHFINSVGADAGFAAIIGLALLILLYFAQARETATLRRHADEATTRIGQLEARIVQLTRSQSAAPQAQGARPPVSVGSVATGPIAARALAPAAPAGVAAPALAAATRLIPLPAHEPVPAAVAEPVVAASVATEPAPGALADGPPPATVAGGANGSGAIAPPRPVSAMPAVQGQPGITRRGAPPNRRPPGGPGGRVPPVRPQSRFPRGLGIALGALGVIAVVVVLLIVTGALGGSNSSSSSTGTQASNASRDHRTRTPAVNPASVTVAVLNGTATNGLAHRIAQNLHGSGYKQGTEGNAPEQTHTTTIVAYLPGFKRDAEAVARTLKLGPSVVAPVDQNTQSVACAGANPCTANVVVTVGANLANAA
jgi:LytR cell envelope-related transcriptional attenuator